MTQNTRKYPVVTVVILHYSGLDLTRACIESLQKQTYRNIRIILVDNASDDHAGEVLRPEYDSIEIIINRENYGYSGGNNVGMTAALEQGTNYVLLINNDAVAEPSYIEEVLAVYEKKPDAGIVSTVINYYEQPERIWYGGGKFNPWFFYTRHAYMDKPYDVDKHPPLTETDYVTGCALMIRADILREVGLFWDKLFLYFEDLDLSYRVRQTGHKCYILWKPLVLHQVSASSGRRGSNKLSPFMAYYFARNPILLIRARMQGIQAITGIVGQFTIRLGRYTYQAILSGSYPALWRYFWGMYHGLVEVLEHSPNNGDSDVRIVVDTTKTHVS